MCFAEVGGETQKPPPLSELATRDFHRNPWCQPGLEERFARGRLNAVERPMHSSGARHQFW
jgi:hypothetical protein